MHDRRNTQGGLDNQCGNLLIQKLFELFHHRAELIPGDGLVFFDSVLCAEAAEGGVLPGADHGHSVVEQPFACNPADSAVAVFHQLVDGEFDPLFDVRGDAENAVDVIGELIDDDQWNVAVFTPPALDARIVGDRDDAAERNCVEQFKVASQADETGCSEAPSAGRSRAAPRSRP